MRTATSAASTGVTERSIGAALDELIRRLGAEPDLVLAYYTADAGTAAFDALRRRLPAGRFAGSSSHRGVMTDEGLFGFEGPAFALWGLTDPEGAYGTGFAPIEAVRDAGDVGDRAVLETRAQEAARQAYQMAVENADRPGELPELVWVLATPGAEEAVLRGLDQVTGGMVPIAGGSAADDFSSVRAWTCFGGDSVGAQGVAVLALFPSTGVATSFQSGFEPTGPSGVVTRADGRLVHEIDGRPAAEVYDEWTRGVLAPAMTDDGDRMVMALTTLMPLGREVGQISVDQRSIPYYSLVHMERTTASKSLLGYADVAEGERLFLMQGSIESMVSRAGRVAETARALLVDGRRGRTGTHLAGALVMYCAGCMMEVGDDLVRVAKELSTAFAGAPFIGAFTFGEQGCLLGGENRHGNLMISVAVFER